MSITYDQYVSQIANLLVVSSGDTNFQTALPGIITDAEQTMYRDLDLLGTRVTNIAGTLTAGNRLASLSTTSGAFLVVEEVNVMSPSSASLTNASRIPLVNTSRDFINLVYPSNATVDTPEFWSMANDATIVVGPVPDAAYTLEVIGTVRPTALSSNNSSTVLTQMLPDAFIAASMRFAAGYQKNFSAMSDDPKAGLTWAALYQQHMQSALVEELRKKYQSQGWVSNQPSPIATPPRV